MINLLCAGRAPSVVVPHLCGASLLACRKKDGGLRPIAVGKVLGRLISKCISRAVQSESFRVLTPLQVGVGVQAGCESIVHALARVQEDSDIPPEDRWWISPILLTVSTGSIIMFQEVRRCIPSMSAWMEMCYGAQSFLRFGEQSILSCCVVQQGDPLGPLGFSLALHPLVEKICT